jgi:predicted enzyme related to lactoylglutathione lyase
MARITGVGGIFFKCADPGALSAWYREMLGLDVASWGGAMLERDPAGPPCTVWAPFRQDTDHFAPSTGDFMINFAVDDMDGFIANLEAKGVAILKRDDSDSNGRFAWLLDPAGTKVELWEPSKT